ncbi:MAG: glycosyltransferase [Burkholderiales bacterium]|nr:glycosyltransferase [Burkholderiales bacterium]
MWTTGQKDNEFPIPNQEPSWAHVSGWSQLSGSMRTVSCVISACNEVTALAELLPLLSDSLTEAGFPWEVIVVDARSDDGTERLLSGWGELPGFRSVRVSRQLSKDANLVIGLEAARGDAVVLLDPKPKYPPSLLQQMISLWDQGAELVYAIDEETSHVGVLKSLDGAAVSRLIESKDPIHLPQGTTDFALFDRRVVTYLLR